MDKPSSLYVKVVDANLGSLEDEQNLEDEWRAAKLFIAKGPSATLQYLKDEPKALLYALEAQALDGSIPASSDLSIAVDPVLKRKQEAWRNLNGMPRCEAKRKFVDLLTYLLPEWKEWHRRHVLNSEGEETKDEVGRLLSDFSKRTGLILKSRL